MKKFIVVLMSFLLILYPLKSFSEVPENSTENIVSFENLLHNENVGEVLTPMKKGQRAPFSGTLLSPLAIAKIETEYSLLHEKINLEVTKVNIFHEAKLEFELEQLTISFNADKEVLNERIKTSNQLNEDLALQLQKEIENRPSKTTWFLIGATTGIVLSLAVFLTVSLSQ